METNQALIASIEAFDIDGGPVKTSFADRLAEEQGWSPEFTDRVIREYKRFVALAMISESPVTPSLIVDEAWHLHLIYTRSYWERFMPLLTRPLHHEPTKGGETEDTKHKDQFVATLGLYRQTFGEEAPLDIWRGKPKPQLEKLERRNPTKWRIASLFAASALILVGCTTIAQADTSSSALPIILIGGFIIIVAIIVAAANDAQKRRDGQNGSSGGGCSSGSGCGTSGGHGSSGHCSGGGHCSGASGGDGGSGGGDGGGGCGGGGCGGD
jgi:hypothetical protein